MICFYSWIKAEFRRNYKVYNRIEKKKHKAETMDY